MTEAIEKASAIVEPTEEEMKVKFPDWDDMSDFEKRMAKDSTISSLRLESIVEATKEFKDMDEWNGKVDTFLTDPETLATYPGIDGKEEAFKIFSLKPSRKGADFSDLVSAFLYAEGSKPKVQNKGKMFERGNGGPSEKAKPKSDKISIEESQRLRVTNYKMYLEYLRGGKIENNLE
jgi:hypothetical protein